MEIRRINIINTETHIDNRGELNTMTAGRQIPFEIKRVFYIHGNRRERGGHAHKKCEQALIAIHGTIAIYINGVEFILSSPRHALHIPPRHEIKMHFDPGSILLVLASEDYDQDDYIQ